MEFKDGASVYSSDQKKAGSLQRVVINPQTMGLTHIVVQKGLLARIDKVIAIQEVGYTEPDGVYLTCSGDKLDELPPLEIEETLQISGAGGVEQSFGNLPGGFSPTPNPQYSVITTMKRTIPEDLIALKLGASVLDEDEQSVGKVDTVITGPQAWKITDLIVNQGLLKQSSKTIPIQWVKMIEENTVYLSIDTQKIEELPEYTVIQ